jgi:hypothetical protein
MKKIPTQSKPQAPQKLTKEDYEKMSAKEAKEYSSASPARRAEILKAVRSRK